MNKEEKIRNAAGQLIEKGNLAVVDAAFAVDYLAHAQGKLYKGHDFIIRWEKQLRRAFPDLSIKDIRIFAEEGNKISWLRTLQGTHQVNLMGIPPSGKKVIWNEMLVSRFEGDKIAEEWIVSELAGQLMLRLH